MPVLQLQSDLVGRPVPAQAEGSPTTMGGEGETREESEGKPGSHLMRFYSIFEIQPKYQLIYPRFPWATMCLAPCCVGHLSVASRKN